MTAVLHRGAETTLPRARASCSAWSCGPSHAARALGHRRDARGLRRATAATRSRTPSRRWSGASPEWVDYAGRTDHQIALSMLNGSHEQLPRRARGARGEPRRAQGGRSRAEGHVYPGVARDARGARTTRDGVIQLAAHGQPRDERRGQGRRLRARALARPRGRRLRLGPARGAARTSWRWRASGRPRSYGEPDRRGAGGRHAARRARRARGGRPRRGGGHRLRRPRTRCAASEPDACFRT